MLTAAPERSFAQRMEALDHANEIRSARCRLKRDIAAGRRRAVDVILRPPECALNMKLFEVLMAMPKVGQVKTMTMLNRCRISTVKTLGGLSERQRDEVASLLGGHR